MALTDVYVLDVDIKETFDSVVPTFRSGDNVEFVFRINDGDKEFDISSATSAYAYQTTPSGRSIKGECTFEFMEGRRVIRYKYEDEAMIEIGHNTFVLVIMNEKEVLSIRPFLVFVHDDLQGETGSYVELIQDLMAMLDNLAIDLNNVLYQKDKGVANGVATLDVNGKIPVSQLPSIIDSITEHIPKTIFKDKVHGVRIQEGVLQYETKPNNWQNVGFHPDAEGGGSGNNQFLNLDVLIEDGKAKLTYIGVPTVESQKWEIGDKNTGYFENNGNTFEGLEILLYQSGIHTIWYRDSGGNIYTKTFNVTQEQLDVPTLNVEVVDGVAEVISNKPLEIKKWDRGERDITHFQNSGFLFTGNSFTISEVGIYTIYIKDIDGFEMIKVINVTEDMLPPVDNDAPVLTLTQSKINENLVRITAIATDEGSGIYSITKPDNTIVYTANTIYDVTDNGTYTFKARDVSGNETTESIVVNSLDKIAPVINLNHTPTTTTGGNVTINVQVTDIGAGVATIKWSEGNRDAQYFLNNGTVLTGNSFVVNDNGTYTVFAVDKAGNTTVKSIEITNILKAPPTINLTLSTTNWTKNDVNVNTQIQAVVGTIVETKWAQGSRTESYFNTSGTVFNGFNFPVSTNNTYTVFAKDSFGNTTVESIVVTNIDKIAPTLTLSQTKSNGTATITANASDALSGVASITKPDGTVVNSTSTTHVVYGNGSYTFTAIDNAGNEYSRSITVTGLYVNDATQVYYEGGNSFKVTRDGEVYSQGENNRGQLGIGSASYDINNTPRLAKVNAVTKVVASSSQTYFITKSGDVYFSGASSSYNFPLPYADYPTPTKIPTISGAVDLRTNVNGDVLFIKDIYGRWLAMGRNDVGQLGLGYNSSERITTPVLINTMGMIEDIASEFNMSVFVTQFGSVYYSGTVRLPLYNRNTTVSYPTELTGFPSSKPKKVALSPFGDNVYFILDNTGAQVMGLGYNKYYELGQGYNSEIADSPIFINGIGGAKDIKAGNGFAVAINNNSKLFGMGRSSGLGLSGTYAQTPTELNVTGTISYIGTSDFATLAYTSTGRVYGTGNSPGNGFANSAATISGRFDRLTALE